MKTVATNIFKIISYATLLPLILATYCDPNLRNSQWLDDWKLLLTNNQLLRQPEVQADDQLFMVCNNNLPVIHTKCNIRSFDVSLPLPETCTETNSIKPIKIVQKSDYCQYTLYKIGYNIQVDSNIQFYETYRVCFDQEHMRPVFTINKAYPPDGGRPNFLQFNPDDIFYGNPFYAYTRSNTFQRFKQLLGNGQTYMSSSNLDQIIDRGHLTPSADFITTNLKRSTFTMINAVPQFKTINNGNWRLIEEWARHKSRTPANICNGVIDCNLNSNSVSDLNCILQLKGVNGQMVPMFLADTRKVPIPLWIYKIVKSNNARTVFLTYNNIYHEGDIKPPTDVCQQIECPLYLEASVKDGRTFCCNYENFIDQVVPNLKEIC